MEVLMVLKIIKTVLLIIGILLFIDSMILMIGGFNISKLFSALFGCGLIAAVFADTFLLKLNTHIPVYVLRSVFLIFIASFLIVEGFLISSANRKTTSADAVIVLGAGLIGKSPSALLAQRLNTAVLFLKKNKDAVCVVSGGQGKDEQISEAEAMESYLVRRGIDKTRILKEDKSTSTNENFAFSKKVLDEYFRDKNYTSVYITNSFHNLRAGLIAKRNGVVTSADSAPTLWYTRTNYYIREYFAMLKFLFIGE